jgi:signal transduction histidine kinase
LLVDIYPPTLQRSGLAAALEDLVAPLRSAGITVECDVPEDYDLTHETEALFYRVAQEAVRNARHHGHATSVRIQLSEMEAGDRFSISDDGHGFSMADLDEAQRDEHFGLRLMQDLVDHANGELEIISAPGAGTAIVVKMPRP